MRFKQIGEDKATYGIYFSSAIRGWLFRLIAGWLFIVGVLLTIGFKNAIIPCMVILFFGTVVSACFNCWKDKLKFDGEWLLLRPKTERGRKINIGDVWKLEVRATGVREDAFLHKIQEVRVVVRNVLNEVTVAYDFDATDEFWKFWDFMWEKYPDRISISKEEQSMSKVE